MLSGLGSLLSRNFRVEMNRWFAELVDPLHHIIHGVFKFLGLSRDAD